MTRFAYADGQKICVFDGDKTIEYKSGYVEKYKENAETSQRNAEWKKSGEGALFRGDATFQNSAENNFDVSISGVYITADEDWMVYSFSVNQTSGIYKKCLSDAKIPETHIINSNSLSFGSGMLSVNRNKLALSVQRNSYNSDIAVFDLDTGDYKTVTDGDTLDVDPYISPNDGNIIYFSSRGAGRDNHGEFIEYSPAAVCRLDLNAMTVDEIVSSPKYSYFKPVFHGGKLYAIKAPVKEKRTNPLLEIILLPWRILQGIASFINIFVTATTGKGLTEGGSNPARGKDYDSRKIEIAGNLIDVDKQLKKNASKKDSDFGFIPKSWELVEVNGDNGADKVIKKGIGDFDVAENGAVIATNGKRIFEIKDGKCKKVCNADYCIKVSCRHGADTENVSSDGFFD